MNRWTMTGEAPGPTRGPETDGASRIAVIGAGFGGVGTAIRLRQSGFTDFVVFERGAAVGGVWRDNGYPGCACDVESHLYEYRFAPNPDWTERYARRDEIWAYLERCATERGVRPHLRLREEIQRAAWDDEASRWRLETNRGRWSAEVVVLATGALSEPALPSIPGLERFEGPAFHSARWRPDFDPTGRRVAVVGSGASAVQVVPALQPLVRRLVVMIRTPAWVVPRRNAPVSEWRRALYRRLPWVHRLGRERLRLTHELFGIGFRRVRWMRLLQGIARRHLRRALPDPTLRARLTPDFTIGCKRILVSDDYYPALTRPNVDLVMGGLAGATTGGVVGADGVEHPVDAIVLCTGFRATEHPFGRRVVGRTGRSLHETWAGSPRAHLGTTVAGFPNLFLLQGPNTGLGHTSVLLMIEAQIEHVVSALRYMERTAAAAVEPRAEAQEAFVAEVDRRMGATVWMSGCRSWYLDGTGRNSTLWPGSPGEFRRRVAAFRPADYLIRPAG